MGMRFSWKKIDLPLMASVLLGLFIDLFNKRIGIAFEKAWKFYERVDDFCNGINIPLKLL